ncbi:MAG: RluA family pseudouridine synthase [Patescibacteria group bacterium]
MEIKIIHEEKDFIAVEKPAGVLVHKTRTRALDGNRTEEKTLVNLILEKYPEVKSVGDFKGKETNELERYGIVHRLDRETSGVIIIARTQKFFDILKKQFQNHEIKKEYMALVKGKLKGNGIINKPIGLRSGTTKHSVNARNMKMVKDAITEYEVIEAFPDETLIRVIPKTGRTHQIRVHFASIGHPVIGDKLYGQRKGTSGLSRQFLHAAAIEFIKADGKRTRIESELPVELSLFLDGLRKVR